MGKLIRLNQGEVEAAQEFADLVSAGKITHGIACYRTEGGDIQFCLVNPEHSTYIIGLMERAKITLHDLATDYDSEEEDE